MISERDSVTMRVISTDSESDYGYEELLAFLRQIISATAFIAQTVSLAVVLLASPYYWKQPCHISNNGLVSGSFRQFTAAASLNLRAIY
jgi:hypothetical protein